jgi:hypothetical protein
MLSNKEEAKWGFRIVKALEWRKRYSFESAWPAIDAYYRHQFDMEGVPRFNLIYMMGQTLIPNLVFQSPGIINTPARDDMTFLASIWDSIDNTWIRHSEMKEIAKETVLSSYLHNTTATQIGYDFGTESDELREKQTEAFGEIGGSVNRTRAQNMPWVDTIPSHRFIAAPGTIAMRNCIWAGKLVSMPIRILKSINNVKNVTHNKLPEEIHRMETEMWEGRDPDKWCHFWEIHDAETKQWFWLGTHGKFILPPQPDPLQVYGLPYEILSFNKNNLSIFGTPDAEYVKSQQFEGDEVRLHGMYMRRYSLPKFFYDSNVIDPDEVAKMMEARVGPGIPVTRWYRLPV